MVIIEKRYDGGHDDDDTGHDCGDCGDADGCDGDGDGGEDDDGDDVTAKAGTGFRLKLEGPGLEVRLALLKNSSTTPTKVLEPLKEYYKTQ